MKNQIGIGGEWVDLKLLLQSFFFDYMFIWCGLDGTDGGLERSQLNLYANVYSCCINNCQKLEKNPLCLSAGEWINWYIHITYYLTIKRNVLLTYAVTWMSLKIIRRSKKSHTQIEDTYYMLPFT